MSSLLRFIKKTSLQNKIKKKRVYKLKFKKIATISIQQIKKNTEYLACTEQNIFKISYASSQLYY